MNRELINNRVLLAEFEGKHVNEGGMSGYDWDDLEYDSSWDWLIPVVTKAFNKACEMDLNGVIGADDHRQAIMDAHLFFDKEGSFKAVVNFVKWCNMKRDEVIEIWMDAEDAGRGEDYDFDKVDKLKDKFVKEFDKLSKEDQQYVRDYLDSGAG
jgi:hypothetical protein